MARNPFPYLYRDSDAESMSDGWDAPSAHGFLETVDDPSAGADGRRRARAFRVAALNSGMWLVMATHASRRLMAIMSHRMATEDLWDQSGYNLELWLASRDAHATAGATVRVMDPLCFANSKVMFRFIRHSTALRKEKHVPVAMHANYHTDKAYKMQRVYEYYAPGGTVAALGKRCDVGCDADVKSIAELESARAHSVNDGVVGSKKWVDGAGGGVARGRARRGRSGTLRAGETVEGRRHVRPDDPRTSPPIGRGRSWRRSRGRGDARRARIRGPGRARGDAGDARGSCW